MHQQNQRLRREPSSHEGGIAAGRMWRAATIQAGRSTRGARSKTSYSSLPLWLCLHHNDLEPPCQTHGPFFVGSMGLESVPRAAVVSLGASNLALPRRLEYVALHGRQRGAGSLCCGPRRVTRPWPAQHLLSPGAVLPNPSLKLSPNGGPPGPGRRYPVHCRQPGPGVPPSVPT